MGGWGGYVSEAWVLQKTDSSATKRGGTRNANGLWIALGEAVLRRPMVRTRTDTSPVRMGLGTGQGRECLEKQSFPLLSGEASVVGAGAELGAVITRW